MKNSIKNVLAHEDKIGLFFTLAIYFFGGFFILRYYQYYVVSDIVPYIAIAQKYLQGDFIHAVNGIWGVLISWLLIPFLFVGFKPVFAFKLLNLCVGGVTLLATWFFEKKFGLKPILKRTLLLILVPIIWSFALLHTTPDLLVVCILVFYLNILFDKGYETRARNAVYLGLLGGFGYLTKHYVFCFVIIHIFISHLFKYFYHPDVSKRKRVVVNFFVSFFIFAVISSLWIGALSYKYGYFNIGTSPAYNHAWMAPDSKGQAPEYMGFVPPPNPTASSMWEDLSYYTQLMPHYDWSPLHNRSDFIFQVKLITHNIYLTTVMFSKFSFLWPIIIAGIFWRLYKVRDRREILADNFFLSLVVIALYSAGYTTIITSDRYLWIVCILLALIGTQFLGQLGDFLARYKCGKNYLTIITVLFFTTFLIVPVRRFLIDVNSNKYLYDASNVLKKYDMSGNVASDTNWVETSILSFYLGTKYYGIPGERTILPDDFKKYSINYYFVWNTSTVHGILTDSQILTTIDGVTVYKLEN